MSASVRTGACRRRRRGSGSALILATALLLLLAFCACPSAATANASEDAGACASGGTADGAAEDGTCANNASANSSAKHDEDEQDGESYVHKRIATQYEDGRIYRGTIAGYTPAADTMADNGLWHIVYDDGDEGEIGGYDHLQAALELFDSLQAEAGAGVSDPSASNTEPKQKKTHSKMTGKKKGVPPEECTSWVSADITRCLVAESRPRMLLHCADACRDVAGVTADQLTSEQRLEDAARGFLYYFHEKGEEYEEEDSGDEEYEEEESEDDEEESEDDTEGEVEGESEEKDDEFKKKGIIKELIALPRFAWKARQRLKERRTREEKKYSSAAEEEEDDEAEAGGASPCTDHDDRCAEWIYDHDGCLHNADFMAETCPKSCHVCFPAGEVTVITFGVEQLTDYHGNEVANAAIADVIERTAEYMLDHVMVEDKYEDVRRDCYNFDTKCSYYAAVGLCDDEDEMRWMQEECGPACQTCATLEYWHKCGRREGMVDVIQAGGMVALFENIIDNYPRERLTILSHPERRKDFLDARGLALTELEPAIDYTELGYDSFEDWIENEKDWITDLSHEKPYVVTLENFLSEEECDFFIKEGYRLGFEQSEKILDLSDENMGDDWEPNVDSGRTSRNTFCGGDCYTSEINQAVMNRIEALTGIPKENSEDLQLLKYEIGQLYEEHHDTPHHWKELYCGHRILTVFLYLSDVEEGGETRLNALNIQVKPKKGMALIWPSVRDDDPNEVEDWGWHEAQPVTKGQKFGANAWFHCE